MEKQKVSYLNRNILTDLSILTLILISSVLLTACGGGGNNGGAQIAAPEITRYDISSRIETIATKEIGVNEGDSITITAVFKNGAGSIDNGVGVITSGTPIELSPTKNTNFTLSVINSAGKKVSRSILVFIVDSLEIISFTASSSTITEGESFSLKGSYRNGSGFLDHGFGRVDSGFSLNFSPRVTTAYTLTVTNNYGASLSRTLTVIVEPTAIGLSIFPAVNLDLEVLTVTVRLDHSDFDIASLSASIGEITKPLINTQSTRFAGEFLISGFVSGEHKITVTAKDVKGNVVSKLHELTIDRKPTIALSKPLKQSILRTSQLPIEVSCHDDLGDCKLTVTLVNDGETITERKATNRISDTLDLTNFDGHELSLRIEAQDSVNQRIIDYSTLYVEMTDTIEEVKSVSGFILDFNGTDILKMTPEKTLRIQNLATDNIIEVDKKSDILPNGSYLTPTGAIFATDHGRNNIQGTIRFVYEWRNSQLTTYASQTSFDISGDYSFDTRSIRRFSTGEKVDFPIDQPSIQDYSLGNNGVLVFIESGKIKKFESGVVTTLVDETNNISGITHDSDSRFLYIFTDQSNGFNNTIYRDQGGEVVLSEFESIKPRKFQNYQINNGWVAFTRLGTLGQKHIWSRDPSGVVLQRTIFGADSVIEKLAANGDIMLVSGDKRYLSRATGELTDVGASFGEIYLIDGAWYRSIGSSLFKLK